MYIVVIVDSLARRVRTTARPNVARVGDDTNDEDVDETGRPQDGRPDGVMTNAMVIDRSEMKRFAMWWGWDLEQRALDL